MGRRKGVGQVLKRLREAKALTQDTVAQKAGITQEYVAKLESGAKKNPSLEVLKRLAKAMGVSVTELLE